MTTRTRPLSGLSEMSTPDDVRKIFTEAESAISELYEIAPEEIRADMKAMTDAYGQLIALYEKVEWDLSAVSFEEFQAIDTSKADEAAGRLDTWETTNCK